VWESVPYHLRDRQLRTREAAHPKAERILAAALAGAQDWEAAEARVSRDESLDPLVKSLALDLLTERCNTARSRLYDSRAKRAERAWIAHMLGLERWPNERDVERKIAADETLPCDANDLMLRARKLVGPDGARGDPVYALALARRALEVGVENRSVAYRDAIPWCLFRLGRFDESIVAQRRMLADGGDEEYIESAARLDSEISSWRDEQGQLRRAEWTARLDALDREIAAIASDPDVRLWNLTNR
jgi:tetratricopeptide (TPR) repeat protein